MKFKILKRKKIEFSPEPEDYTIEWDLLFLEIGKFKIDFLTDFGEWFCYIHLGKKWWRFSSAGYLKYKDAEPIKKCKNCSKQRTMDCPNSYFCYNTLDKPYFETKKENI